MVRIELTGEFQKEKDENFTEEEIQKFRDEFYKFVESKKMIFIGTWD